MSDTVKYERIKHWETVIHVNDLIVKELEEIKNEMIKTKGLTEAFDYVMIINKHIEELKGR